LHDGIIQSLYAVSLSLDDVSELMASSRGEAEGSVDATIDSR
jgi:signal transduction histidine kinase